MLFMILVLQYRLHTWVLWLFVGHSTWMKCSWTQNDCSCTPVCTFEQFAVALCRFIVTFNLFPFPGLQLVSTISLCHWVRLVKFFNFHACSKFRSWDSLSACPREAETTVSQPDSFGIVRVFFMIVVNFCKNRFLPKMTEHPWPQSKVELREIYAHAKERRSNLVLQREVPGCCCCASILYIIIVINFLKFCSISSCPIFNFHLHSWLISHLFWLVNKICYNLRAS